MTKSNRRKTKAYNVTGIGARPFKASHQRDAWGHARGSQTPQPVVGLLYLLSRLGWILFGTLIRGVVDESKIPLQALTT